MSDSWLETLSLAECQHLLRARNVGRIGAITDDWPIVVPVNYRLIETSGLTWIALRTRPGTVIERAAAKVAFEIDEIDPVHRKGWSVVARGTLHPVDSTVADFRERFDPEPWLLAERDAWLVIQPFAITGRRLRTADADWAFHPRGYV